MDSFDNKTAFVTGAASGIGFELARSLLTRGANVMLADIDGDNLSAAMSELSSAGGAVDHVVCSVADAASVQDAADKTVDRFGKIHILANNAGVSLGGVSGEIPLQDWRWIVDINLMGVIHGVEIFTPLIKSHGEGDIF